MNPDRRPIRRRMAECRSACAGVEAFDAESGLTGDSGANHLRRQSRPEKRFVRVV